MALWVLTDNYIISKVAKALNIAMKGRLIYMLDNTQKTLQKAISFTVPCYNSADYMDNCIQSLIDLNSGDDDIEIIIVDDGSNEDNTLEKALYWEKKYPTTVRVIHQENGGPGQAVNTGLKNAKGLYFKVVDSDDYLDKQGSVPILEYIRRQAMRIDDGSQATDMIIGNYVYNKAKTNKITPINYTDALPENREFTWNDIKRFKIGEYLFMHSIIYRTQLLHDISLELPKHTFYVDSIVACYPLPYVKSAYYINTNMYMYNIGREDQSVNEEVIVSRVDQVLRVAKIVIDTMDIKKLKTMPKLEQYYYHQLAQMMSVCTVILRMINTEEAKAKLKDIWNHLKKTDKHVYFAVFRSPLCCGTNIPGELGRAVCLGGYKAAKKLIPFT